ncbi:hypothetical protein M3Y99_01663500 [Aphelenchoides fujianensis]|nr:hypothetical protein M3Y99_01663500 [Aphelenchoides fujianensis]
MNSALPLALVLLHVALSAMASHHWDHPHHDAHHAAAAHGHDGEWAARRGDAHDWRHADRRDHAHDAGFAKGDRADWARLDYGGHKRHESGDSFAEGYAHEHGDDHARAGGWEGGHHGGHSAHSSHAHHKHPHHFGHHPHGHFGHHGQWH